MVLESQDDAAGTRVFAGPMYRVDAPASGVRLRCALLQIAGKDPNRRRMQFRRKIHPAPDVIDLTIQLWPRRVRERVAHGGPRDVEPLEERVAAQRAAIFRRWRIRKVVRRRFDGIDVVRRAEIHEIVERHGFPGPRERGAEGVRRKAQLHPGRTGALHRLDGDGGSWERRGCRRRGHAAEEVSSVHGLSLLQASRPRSRS